MLWKKKFHRTTSQVQNGAKPPHRTLAKRYTKLTGESRVTQGAEAAHIAEVATS
jgi:hypothetical protein